MRYINTLLFLLLAGQLAMGQANYRVIGAADVLAESLSTDFFIQSIKDHRSFKANLGVVNRGKRKVLKRPLIQEYGFFDEIQEKMNSWLIPGNGAEPISVQLKELYLWENQGLSSTKGYVRLEVTFIDKSGAPGTTISVLLSGDEIKVADGHAPRLEAAFFRCLQQYNEQRRSLVQVSNKAPAPSAEEKSGRRPRMMAAANFLDFRKGELYPSSGKLRRKGGPYRYKLVRGGEEQSQPYYALTEGDDLYIWASNYSTSGRFYYTRVLEQGRYLFLIDDIYIRPPEMEYLESEASGRLVARKVGILIDTETGVPQVVDDELMEQVMRPYPELQEKYLLKDILNYPFQLTRVQNVIAEINRLEAGKS